MDVKEFHKQLDLCESEDESIRTKAQQLVEEWEKDIQTGQSWRNRLGDDTKADDVDSICTVMSVSKKKVKVIIDNIYNPEEDKKVFFFGRNSFLKKWERMF